MRYFLRFVLFCTCLTLCNIPHSRAAVDFHPEKPTIEEQGKWSSALERWQHKWLSKIEKVVSEISPNKDREKKRRDGTRLWRLSKVFLFTGGLFLLNGILVFLLQSSFVIVALVFVGIGFALGLTAAILAIIARVRDDQFRGKSWFGYIFGFLLLPLILAFIFFIFSI
jgi:uncharacterized membrane-anchored protein